MGKSKSGGGLLAVETSGAVNPRHRNRIYPFPILRSLQHYHHHRRT